MSEQWIELEDHDGDCSWQCPICNGNVYTCICEDSRPVPRDASYDNFILCTECDGAGEVWWEDDDEDGVRPDGRPGHVEGHYVPCPVCAGKKWVNRANLA